MAKAPRKANHARAASVSHRAMKWQEECVAISRQKGKQRLRSTMRRRAFIACSLMVPACFGIGGWFMWQSGEGGDASAGTRLWVLEQTRRLGFEVRRIEIVGLDTMTPASVAKAAGILTGDPMLQVSVKEARDRLKAVPEIREARVERVLPDTVRLIINERQPTALWQMGGKQQWIDRDGTVLRNQTRVPHSGDIVLVGDDVPAHAEAFLAMMEKTPTLQKMMQSAQRIGARRWDVKLTNGMVVKLPQQNMEQAWQRFADAVNSQHLFDRAVRIVDLRLNDRAVLTVSQPSENTKEKIKIPSLSGAEDV